jgi:hypothetical protein
MKKLLIILAILIFAAPAMAQTWVTANQATLAWDAVAKIATTDTIKYQTYTKSPLATSTPQKVGGEVTATQQPITFSVEGRYFLCVETLRYPQGETLAIKSARMACTDVATDTQAGVATGVIYYTAPGAPGVLRIQ